MNLGQMLVDLGYQSQPKLDGLATPAYIKQPAVKPGPPPVHETVAEIEGYIDHSKGIGGRSFPYTSTWHKATP